MLAVPNMHITDNLHTDRHRAVLVFASVCTIIAIAVITVVLAVSRSASGSADRPTHSTVQSVDACRPTLAVHPC